MHSLQRQRRMDLPAWGMIVPLLLTVLLAACGGSSPTATPKPGGPVGTGAALATSIPGTGPNLDKVDNVFLQLLTIYQTQGLDAARNYATDQGLMTKQNEVRVTLVLDSTDANVVDGTALSVGRLGGRVTQSFDNTIELVVPVQALLDYPKTHNQQSFFKDLSDFSHVKSVRRTPVAKPESTLPAQPAAGEDLRAAGGTSEGVALTGADKWQAAGITGKGIKVGVIDSNFNNYKQFLGTAKVTAKSFRSDGLIEEQGGEIHGTACAEIVHEMAPDAEVMLAAFQTFSEFASALRWLTANGATVVTASMGFGGYMPADGTSALDQEIDKAKAAGVLFFKSAGNSGSGKIKSDSLEGHIGGTFSNPDRDGFTAFQGTQNANGVLLSAPNATSISIRLTWDDWKQPHVNYDLYLFDSKGQEVARSDNDQSTGTKAPVEVISGKAPAGQYVLKVKKVKASDPNLPFDVFFSGLQAEVTTPDGSLTPPGDAKGAVAVAAINVRTNQLEPYSSHGPTRDGRKKPEIGAPDDVTSAAYASTGAKSFPGTSAAAPHAAGAAALYRQAFPDSNPDAVLTYFTGHAKKLQGTGDNAFGAGLIFMDAVPQGAKTTPAPTKATGATPAAGTRVPTQAAKPTTQAAGAPSGAAFYDNFSSSSTGLPAAGYQNGEYHIKLDAGAVSILAYPNKAVPDGPGDGYQVDVRRVSGPNDVGMGLVFRVLDKDDFLVFVVYNDGAYALFAKVDGSIQEIIPAQPDSAIKPGAANRLQVFGEGEAISLVANGTLLQKITLSGVWTGGQFGIVAVGSDTAASEVAFKDYAVFLG